MEVSMFGRIKSVLTRKSETSRHHSIPMLESLENRRLLSVVTPGATAAASARDSQFLQTAESDTQLEIELGNLAQTNGMSPTVKAVGAAMVADGTAVQTALGGVAANLGVDTGTNLNGADQAIFNRLSKLTGVQFDRAYAKAMTTTQRKDLISSERESMRSDNVSIQTLIAADLPVVETHLVLAQSARAAAIIESMNAGVGVANSAGATTSTTTGQAAAAASGGAISTGAGLNATIGATPVTFTAATTSAAGTASGMTQLVPITGMFSGSVNLATGVAMGTFTATTPSAGNTASATTQLVPFSGMISGSVNLATGAIMGSFTATTPSAGITGSATTEVAPITGTSGGSGDLATGTATGSGGTVNIANATGLGGTTNIAGGRAIGSGGTVNIADNTGVTGTFDIGNSSATRISGTASIANGSATGASGTFNIANGSTTGLSGTVNIADGTATVG
jgi:putative membrane protein